MDTSQKALPTLGKASLFIGIESAKWSLADFSSAAKLARAAQIDSLIFKVGEDGADWYSNEAHDIHQAIWAQGVGALPYIYSYGDKFGNLQKTISQIERYLAAYSLIGLDLEAEWNGQVGWAQTLANALKGKSGALYISCLADPQIQNQNNVLKALAPVVSVWMPQVYTDYLQSVWYPQFKALGLSGFCPTCDLTPEFGPNNPLSHVKANSAITSGYTSIWEYQPATGASAALCKQIIAQVKPAANPTAPASNTEIISELHATLITLGEMNEHALAQLAQLNL